ncbi:phosphatidylinositol 4-phosphate 5-kinase 8 [Pelomyxa schiedti]|nr:phosphatidylinositol 4-phosphate 5-kinase 8 [Pelomyxa schiedti]
MHGRMDYFNGSVYYGTWTSDKHDGRGTMTWRNGDKYCGCWNNDMKEGEGTQNWEDGSIYTGNWHKNQQHGHGVMQSQKKAYIYDGMWRNGKKHGTGTIKYTNGDAYVGSWANGMKEGEGTQNWKDGSIYTGNWHKNLRHGHGVLQSQHKAYIYDGMWKNNKKQGTGTIKYTNGDTYVGSWENGKRNNGIETKANGDTYDGQWTGREEGSGVMRLASGECYIGKWMDDKPTGNGEMTMKNGDVYSGEWVLGKISGQGTVTRAKGPGLWIYNNSTGDFVTFSCNFVKGKRNGLGKFALKDGREIACHWVNDEPDPDRPHAVLVEVNRCINKLATCDVITFNYVEGVYQHSGIVGEHQSAGELEERQVVLKLPTDPQKELETVKTELEQLNCCNVVELKKLEVATEVLKLTKKELKVKQQDLDHTLQCIQELQNENNRLTSCLKDTEAAASSMKIKMDTSYEQIDYMGKQLAELETERESEHGAVIKLEEGLKALAKENEQLQQENKQLDCRVQDTKATLCQERTAMENLRKALLEEVERYKTIVNTMTSLISATPGDFGVEKLLGTGSNAAAFKVKYRTSGSTNNRSLLATSSSTDMVMKVLFNWENTPQQTMLRQKYMAECVVLSLVPHHPNVIHPLGAIVIPCLPSEFVEKIPSDQPVYRELGNHKSLAIIMPHCGITLSSFLTACTNRTVKIAQSLFVQGVKAIQHIESHSIVHRDIKGDNILVDTENGRLTLIDFGEAQVCPNMEMTITATTETWGNTGTIPPELSVFLKCITRGGSGVFSYSKCDSFALALTFWDALLPQTNRFIGSTMNHDMSTFNTQSLLNEFPVLFSSKPTGAPTNDALESVMIGMMNTDKSMRLSATQAISALTS